MDLGDLSWATSLVWLALAFAAALYSTSGHGGATAYLALFGLFGVAPETMRPLALIMNVVVAGLGVFRLWRVGAVPHRLLGLLLLGSVPGAFVGGMIPLSSMAYRGLLGATLLVAAARLFLPSNATASPRQAPAPLLVVIGVVLGFLSGLTGIGGGIFLSPLVILSRLADPRQTAGAAASFIVINSVVGLCALGVRGGIVVDGVAVIGCTAAVLVGGAVGTTFAARGLSFRGLRVALATVLVLSGAKLLSEWRPSPRAESKKTQKDEVVSRTLSPSAPASSSPRHFVVVEGATVADVKVEGDAPGCLCDALPLPGVET